MRTFGVVELKVARDSTEGVAWRRVFVQIGLLELAATPEAFGDGKDDVFVGTGADWYYSSGGQSEWRFLNRMAEHASALLFGDFDGDGRTDILALHGRNVDISWNGMSAFETINTVPPGTAISDLAVGDFDGDGQADLFLATGTQWLYAPGGRTWTPLAISSYRTRDLLFGDFVGIGRTQALRISNGRWEAAGLGMPWTNIGSAPVSSIAGLVVGHFNGDGFASSRFADVATSRSGSWKYSTPARGNGWITLRSDSSNIASHPIGDFYGDGNSDVLFWKDLSFSYAASARSPVRPASWQDMR